MRRLIGRLLRAAAILLLIGAASALAASAYVQRETAGKRVAAPADLPRSGAPRDAIVFGAGLRPNGSPTPVLADRVATAVDLYKRGAVRRLLMSGDGGTPGHDEPRAMRDLAISLGVPAGAIVTDPLGLRTFDSCARAASVYGIQRAVAVTQNFHLARATYTCAGLGIDTIGISSDRRDYSASSYAWWTAREVVSTLVAYLDVNVLRTASASGAH